MQETAANPTLAQTASAASGGAAMRGEKVSVFYGDKQALFDVDLEIARRQDTPREAALRGTHEAAC